MLRDGQTILFQGDSITDAGRRDDPQGLGSGYVRMAAGTIAALHPDKKISVLNRGIGGNTVIDLEARWEQDCIELRPDILFIFIGINDTSRGYDAEAFEAAYRRIILRAKEETGARIILVEPFLLPVPVRQETCWGELAGKKAAVRRLSREFSLPFIPLDGIFAALSAQTPMETFAADGVHPTHEGARVIAAEILKRLGVL